MSTSNSGAERRLERLERVLAGRRRRLANALARSRRPVAHPGPLPGLQRYGYGLALVLVATAVLPTVVGFTFRRRGLLLDIAKDVFGYRKLQQRLDAMMADESDR